METKKILLTAINAKYIHSNLAVYSLKAYARECLERQNAGENEKENEDKNEEKVKIDIAEYTINQQADEILMDIYRRHPDMLCFSCYIWNIQYVREIVREAAKILPDAEIWLGGPEVSYDAVRVLEELPEVAGVMKGEGEETFARLVLGECKHEMTGITFRDEEGRIIERPWREVMDLNKVPFIYRDMTDFANKIIYYESSRGCPFSCSYCLSSVDKKLRFRDIELVKKELQFFIDREVPQVKFVDRTFNCSHTHAMEIWKYLTEHDRGITNFHFEISADLLNEEEIAMIQSMRPGLIQLEIGVQSTCPETIREIRRTMKFEKVAEAVRAVGENGNVHQHLDLIAGLPYENLERFEESFNDVYALKPEQLQLGFLKVLKGSFMEQNRESYGLICKDTPPYEVLCTRWLSYDDVLCLKGVEEMVEIYYNSGQFSRTIRNLEEEFPSAFGMYRELAEYYTVCGFQKVSHSRVSRYEILLEFIQNKKPEKAEIYRELLTYDYYLRENAKNRPEFAGEYRLSKEEVRLFYEEEAESHRYLPDYGQYDRNQMRRMTHLEYFPHLEELLLFDYAVRNPLTKEARTVKVDTRYCKSIINSLK